jgi:RHS repeat-associated protein
MIYPLTVYYGQQRSVYLRQIHDPRSVIYNFRATRFLPGGGAYHYTGYQSGSGQFAAQRNDGAILVMTSQNPERYEVRLADGSVLVYGHSDGATAYPRRIFLSEMIDPQGNALALNYDGQFRLVSLTDATGRDTTFSYGLAGKPLLVTKITDPFGRSATLTYDFSGRLSSITDIIGLTSQVGYDANSLVNSLTTPYGTTTFVYTPPGTSAPPRYAQATDPEGNSERVEWFEPASIPSSESVVPVGMPLTPVNNFLQYRNSFYWDKNAYDEAGCGPTGGCDYTLARITHFVHDATNTNLRGTQIESIKYPLENRVWFNYAGQSSTVFSGSFDRPIAAARVLDDGTTQLTETSYDTAGYFNVTETIDAEGRTTTYTYDITNRIDLLTVKQTVAGGAQETLAEFVYNAQHRPTSYTDAAGETTTFDYNTAGQLTLVTNSLGEGTEYQYSATGDLETIINANDEVAASFTYDDYARVRTFTDSEGWTATYDYDAADRVTRITYPDGTSDQFGYENLDLVTYRDRLGRQWTYTYDDIRRLTAAFDPAGEETLFSYTPGGQLASMTDPNGNVTEWEYDVQGRLTKQTYADGTSGAYFYDGAASRLLAAVDPLGQLKRYSYALDDRLTGISYEGEINPTPNVTLAYDAYYPRVASMTDGTGTTSYSYVPVGSLGALQLQQETIPAPSASISYVYDELGRLASRTGSGAGAEDFDYDALGRLTLHDSDLGTFTFAYLGETDQLTTRQLSGANVATTWSYLGNAGDRRLAAIDNDGFVSGQYADFTYDTAPEDLITGIQTDSDATGATPDEGRLLASYNNLNQLTRFAGQRLTYDANGNLLSDGERNYAWDAENRLIGITYPNEAGKSSEFTYDGLSRRVAIEDTAAGGSPTTTTSYLWCGAVICQARDGSNNLERLYFPEGELIPGSPPTAYHYGIDQIGSVRRAFIDASTAPAFEFDPYGDALLPTARVTDFGFAGMFFHEASGLYLTQYRAYDPVAGRWLSRDPLFDPAPYATFVNQGDALNLYAYVRGRPIALVDPRGTNPLAIAGAGAGTLVAPGPGTVAGAVVGTLLGLWVGDQIGHWIAGGQAVVAGVPLPPSACPDVGSPDILTMARPRGAWPGDTGAEEWGRRNRIGATEGRRRFHDIKKNLPGAEANEDLSVDPATGQIYDSNGEPIGNMKDR